ncbi:Pro-Pol poly [Brachionus plicatilis]|uniref:Pro-Pol poly n=1 Tax=Brachionus plicatilis TaxID=10195 RepID=A0A3M7RDA5_BRAPC|nr:Pro-Pol poly [Brachionus plicatilis]
MSDQSNNFVASSVAIDERNEIITKKFSIIFSAAEKSIPYQFKKVFKTSLPPFISSKKTNKMEKRLRLRMLNLVKLNDCIDWFKEQLKDQLICIVKDCIVKNNWSAYTGDNEWFKIRRELKVRNELLVRYGAKKFDQIVVPKNAIDFICRAYHDFGLAGHRGFAKTFGLIYEKFFWVDMQKFIQVFCDCCDYCQRYKHSNMTVRDPLQPIQFLRFQVISVPEHATLDISNILIHCVIAN